MKPYSISSLEHSKNQQGMYPIPKLIMWMSVFLLFFTVDKVYSQVDTLRCMYADTCSSAWTTSHYTGNMGSGITGTIWYRYRDCNGKQQIMIDSTEAKDNGRFLDSMNRYEHHYSAFSDLADLYLLQHRFLTLGVVSQVDTAPTPIVQIYKASCGVWLKCRYDVDPSSVDCDSGFTPPYPTSGTVSAPLDIYKWHPCGTVCCEKTYQVYIEEVYDNGQPPQPISIVKIKNISIRRSQRTPECTEQPKYLEPCNDGC